MDGGSNEREGGHSRRELFRGALALAAVSMGVSSATGASASSAQSPRVSVVEDLTTNETVSLQVKNIDGTSNITFDLYNLTVLGNWSSILKFKSVSTTIITGCLSSRIQSRFSADSSES